MRPLRSQTERKKAMKLFANEIRRLTKQVLLPHRLIKPFRIVVTFRLIIDSGLQKGFMLNHTNSVLRARLLFFAHCTSVPLQNRAPHSDSKKNRKEIPKVLPSANIGKRISTFKASNTSQTLTRHSQNQSTIRHTKRYGHKPARHKDHNNTKPIWKIIVLCNAPRFKLKSKKTAKTNPSLIVIPSKTRKKILIYYLQPT
jgi:hypothetical protein